MSSKFNYWRSREYLKAVSELPCMRCGKEGQTQAAHSNQMAHGKGKGIKASDQYTAALCLKCHYEIDMGKELTKEQRKEEWDKAYLRTLQELKERKRFSNKHEEN